MEEWSREGLNQVLVVGVGGLSLLVVDVFYLEETSKVSWCSHCFFSTCYFLWWAKWKRDKETWCSPYILNTFWISVVMLQKRGQSNYRSHFIFNTFRPSVVELQKRGQITVVLLFHVQIFCHGVPAEGNINWITCVVAGHKALHITWCRWMSWCAIWTVALMLHRELLMHNFQKVSVDGLLMRTTSGGLARASGRGGAMLQL